MSDEREMARLRDELDAERREVERVKWVTEVHLSRHGLWDEQVGLDIRAAWLAGAEVAHEPEVVEA